MKKSKRLIAVLLAVMMLLTMIESSAVVNTSSNRTLSSYYKTNPNGQLGANKTISVDGSLSDWDSSMLIAQGTANDDPRVYRPNSMYEIGVDLYALYAAYDDNNLYLMWEMTNVQDVVAPQDIYPLSQGTLWQTQEFPFFIMVDTGKADTAIGNNGALQGGGYIWGSGMTVQNSLNKLISINTKGGNGPWVYGGDSTGLNPEAELRPTTSNIDMSFGSGILSQQVYGINHAYGADNGRVPGDVCDESAEWVDFNTIGHSSDIMDFFYEMSIPYNELGITKSDVENNGVGVMVVATMGMSPLDCLPGDVCMTDLADLDDAANSQENTSFEKSDEDFITAPFARVGKSGGGVVNPPVTTQPVTDPTTVATDFTWDNVVSYHLLTDRFQNGDESNDNSYNRGLNQDGSKADYNNVGAFQGGDFKGITQKIEDGYFTDLGVNAITISGWFEQTHGYVPGGDGKKSFPHYSYHGYYGLDFTELDKNYGTEAEFKEMIDTAHEHGIRVVMDVVLNHPGYNSIYDMNEYGFGTLLSGWQDIYYNLSGISQANYHGAIKYNDGDAGQWAKWWGRDWVRAGMAGYDNNGGGDITGSVTYLPDFKTENQATLGVPEILKTKWNREGTYNAKVAEIDQTFSKYNLGNKTVLNYLVAWYAKWVEEYGIDGFRCDTAKHVETSCWKKLNDACTKALENWRAANPDAVGADWDEEFWMTGENFGMGVDSTSTYYQNGFDSMINFSFSGNAQGSGCEGMKKAGNLNQTYAEYANQINSNPNFNALSYISSHDTGLCRNDLYYQGSALLLLPGGVQIFYGDESNRQYVECSIHDHENRGFMNWNNMDKNVLAHWQKVGSFRNDHVAVGAGAHKSLSATSGTAFARTYNKNGVTDAVACVIGATKNASTTITLNGAFTDGTKVVNAYTGDTATVSGGAVTFNSGTQGTILVEAYNSEELPQITTIPETAETTEVIDSTPDETTVETTVVDDTIVIYLTTNSSWEGAYIYGFYGQVGYTATGEPLGVYPGTEMTFVTTDENGNKVYRAVIPADIDYIKFSDGSTTNNRTDNIPNSSLYNNIGFSVTTKGTKYWGLSSYTYIPENTTITDPEEFTTAPVETTVPSTLDETVTDPVETTATQVVETTVRVTYPQQSKTYNVAGDEGLCGVRWVPAMNLMDYDGDGTWSKKFTGIAAGTYEFKVVEGGKWGNPDYNLEGTAYGSVEYSTTNAVINILKDNATVVIGFDGYKAVIESITYLPVETTESTEINATFPDEITLYFKNSDNWSSVYWYAWNDDGLLNGAWPGKLMAKVSEDIYSITISGEYRYIIFHNNAGEMTPSLTISGDDMIYADGEWFHFTEDDLPTYDMKRVYFTDNKGWGKARIHAWGDGISYTQWPGALMKYYETNSFGEKVYYYDVPGLTEGILFNGYDDSSSADYSLKTVDIEGDAFKGHGYGYYCTTADSQGLWNVESYKVKIQDVTTTAVTEPATRDEAITEPVETTTAFVEVTLPLIPDEELSFSGASLTLHDNICINFKTNESLFTEEGYKNPCVVYEMNGKEFTVTEYEVVNGRYVFEFADIAPHNMNDTIKATLYATFDGVEYVSETREYSVATYCYNMLNKYTTPAYSKLQTLLVDLLNYGAMSQIYTGHNTDNLVNAKLTDAQKAWGTVNAPTYESVQNLAYKTIENPTVQWKGGGLNLVDAVTMRFKISANSGSYENLVVKAETDDRIWTIPYEEFSETTGGYYVYFSGLNAGEMSETVYLTVYENGVAVSNTLSYSIESYAYSKQNSTDTNLVNLLEAMMKYGNAACAYAN